MKERILKHLEVYGSITSLEAVRDYGCLDLQHYIYLLRKEMEISDNWETSINRFGDKVAYKKYFINKNED